MTDQGGDLIILYDQECPFCDAYIRYSRLRAQFPKAEILNAREDSPARRLIEQRGLSLDAGMAIILDGEIYHGAEAMNRLALMTTRSTLFNRLVANIMANRTTARLLYPLFNGVRKATLFLLGRGSIKPGLR